MARIPAPVHIEPQFLSAPSFYGSPGEPSILSSPTIGPDGPVSFAGGGFSPLLMGPLAMALMMPGPAGDRDLPNRYREGKIRRPDDEMSEALAFKLAFALARRKGLKEFSWRGKRYTTELKR